MKLVTYAGEDSDISITLYATNYRSLLKNYSYNIAKNILIHNMPIDTSYCWITRTFMVKFTMVFFGADNMKRDLRIPYDEHEGDMLL